LKPDNSFDNYGKNTENQIGQVNGLSWNWILGVVVGVVSYI
jgi:hypothetical protein